MSAISRDVLANRRSHDTCDRGECFYPTAIQLAEEVEERERLVLDMGDVLRAQMGDAGSVRKTLVSHAALLARLDQLGKEQT